jgi:uncharacterized membrane protein YkvA (DUF1232 family)
VPAWLKAIPIAGLAYLVFPLDLIADPLLGLGQLDDLAVIVLSIQTFISLCPQWLVEEHQSGHAVVDAEYREITEEEREDEATPAQLTEGGLEDVIRDERAESRPADRMNEDS